MMPSVDHCVNNPPAMTTLTNTLEVFDTYKHREEKDSDEESFHLQLDDDDESKSLKNGINNETEDEILDKFEGTTANVEIDSQLEDRLLNDEEDEKKTKTEEPVLPINGIEESQDEEKTEPAAENHVNGVETEKEDSEEKEESKEATSEDSEKKATNDEPGSVESTEVPSVDIEVEEKVDSAMEEEPCDKDKPIDTTKEDSPTQINDEPPTTNEPDPPEEQTTDKAPETKSDDSNDSTKHQNEDSEDLFDITVIRDAAEDNAESAYNEAQAAQNAAAEENEEEEKMDDKEIDEVEEMETDKPEEQLRNDDVDIEEDNINLDDGVKDSSDGEGESNKTESVKSGSDGQTVSDAVKSVSAEEKAVTECRLDEVTGKLIGAGGTSEKDGGEMDVGNKDSDDSLQRKSLKRANSDDAESAASKKSRTEGQIVDNETKEEAQPKEKPPLRTLLSLSEFMKSKANKRLTMHDLEEFCVQKICEVLVHKSDLGDVLYQLKLQEQLVETMRKEIQQLTKQARDLEIVNKKLMNDLKMQNTTQKPLNPLKITRSVGLQVKFTSTSDTNMTKKRQASNSAIHSQKTPVQAQNRGPRTVQNGPQNNTTRQVTSPQKPQQPQQIGAKPNTPLLSQALQNRTNRAPQQIVRTKSAEAKLGSAPSASVIDLTDEDDKKDKTKNATAGKVMAKNNSFPIRTTPMRVNATAQGIRLTTSQGKGTPISTVVTSSAPQVMYVVQSSSQNALNTALSGQKAVVVNFQSTNGVLTSAQLNGSAVSVIPKQSNTIQLKQVASPPKPIKPANKHPAPLPPPPVVRMAVDKPLKSIPPKPHLTIRKTDTGIILQWKMPYDLDMYECIASYQLYAYQETSASPSTDMWRKVGDVKALALPMACTLTQFADKNKYYFAVRPVDVHKRIGMFSDPEEISL